MSPVTGKSDSSHPWETPWFQNGQRGWPGPIYDLGRGQGDALREIQNVNRAENCSTRGSPLGLTS